MILETAIGSLLGGLFRLAPAVIDHLDRKRERAHELAMLKETRESDRQKAEFHRQGITIEGEYKIDTAAMQALTESIKAQGQPSGVGWVDALSASVRPVLTYWWCLGLYTAALVAQGVIMYNSGLEAVQVVSALWGADEKAIVASMLTFWFVGRVLDRPRRV